MKRVRLMAALTAATVFITTGCQNDTESKIVGKYEHPALPGQTFEFHADHTFMNTTGAGTMDCIIKHPGTWTACLSPTIFKTRLMNSATA